MGPVMHHGCTEATLTFCFVLLLIKRLQKAPYLVCSCRPLHSSPPAPSLPLLFSCHMSCQIIQLLLLACKLAWLLSNFPELFFVWQAFCSVVKWRIIAFSWLSLYMWIPVNPNTENPNSRSFEVRKKSWSYLHNAYLPASLKYWLIWKKITW